MECNLGGVCLNKPGPNRGPAAALQQLVVTFWCDWCTVNHALTASVVQAASNAANVDSIHHQVTGSCIAWHQHCRVSCRVQQQHALLSKNGQALAKIWKESALGNGFKPMIPGEPSTPQC